jgi:molybdopterin synthase sulfur carrier subunit
VSTAEHRIKSMLNIHYFASIREALNKQEEHLELPETVSSVGDLIDYLITATPEAASIFNSDRSILIAVNQIVASRANILQPDDEVAFFPPMTGG